MMNFIKNESAIGGEIIKVVNRHHNLLGGCGNYSSLVVFTNNHKKAENLTGLIG